MMEYVHYGFFKSEKTEESMQLPSVFRYLDVVADVL